MIETKRLTVNRGERTVLHEVSITARDGEVLGIVGPNGSGKTTLMMTLWHSLKPVAGQVLLDGQDVARLPRREIASNIAVVLQGQESSLPLPVRDSVALGRLASRSLAGYGDQADQQVIDEALRRTSLTELADRLMTQLSGGEHQRVLIARAIAQDAPHLLLDEPTNHLDINHQFALMKLIRELRHTTIVVLHDLNLAARFCDQIVVLDQGRLAAAGTPDEVLRPELLNPIYQVQIERVDHRGQPYLIFDPGT